MATGLFEGSLGPLLRLKGQMLRHHIDEFFSRGPVLPAFTFLGGALFAVGGLLLFYHALVFFNSIRYNETLEKTSLLHRA